MMQNAIILAAGLGKRMKTKKPKVLCEVLFKPMVNWVLDTCILDVGINDKNIAVVVGHRSQDVIDVIKQDVQFFYQDTLRGTADAVKTCERFLSERKGEDTLVLCGDSPFIDKETILDAYNYHKRNGFSATVITSIMDVPFGYGRIVKYGENLVKIVEEKDASDNEKEIREVNSGAYWFKTEDLLFILSKIDDKNSQNEFYLTDAISHLINQNKKCSCYKSDNPEIIYGANTRGDLYRLNQISKNNIIKRHMDNGVEIIDINTVFIGPDVVIGSDTVILPNTILKGKTKIGCNCEIGPNSLISDSLVDDFVKVNATQIYESDICRCVTIGPFAHIRPNSCINSFAKIGDFVEIKNSTVGENTSIAHLSYIGDTDIGDRVNVGCGVVTVNYNGKEKHRTKIGDNSFIGCNANLIAPLNISSKSYIAAGSTITDDVEEKSLAIARARQENIVGWLDKFHKK